MANLCVRDSFPIITSFFVARRVVSKNENQSALSVIIRPPVVGVAGHATPSNYCLRIGWRCRHIFRGPRLNLQHANQDIRRHHLAVVHPGVLLLELLGFSHQGLQEKAKRKGSIKDTLLDHVLRSGQSVFSLLAILL